MKKKKPDAIEELAATIAKINHSSKKPNAITLRMRRDYRDDYDKAIRAFNIVRKERDALRKAVVVAYNRGRCFGFEDGANPKSSITDADIESFIAEINNAEQGPEGRAYFFLPPYKPFKKKKAKRPAH